MFYIIRNPNKRYTPGIAVIDGELVCFTQEPLYRDNQPFISCIKPDTYDFVIEEYKGKYLAIRLLDKNDRTRVWIHRGNWIDTDNPESKLDDSDACILPGIKESYLHEHKAIIEYSEIALKKLISKLPPFGKVTIKNVETVPEKARFNTQFYMLSKIDKLEEKKVDVSVSWLDKVILHLDNNRENIGLATDAASGVALKTGNVLWASILMMLSNILRPISEKQKTAKSNILQMIIDFLKWLIKTFTKPIH